jgi:hypothetical protein
MSTSPAASAVCVEYAKSGRSTCKGCSAIIDSGALRLGATARDPRGFDSTKWYHVSCFPASSHPLGPVEGISGFDAIKVGLGLVPFVSRPVLFREGFTDLFGFWGCRTSIARSCDN